MVVDRVHQAVFSYLDALDCSGSRLVVGFSGGFDSTVLLLACQAYCKLHPDISLEALHVNHHLHPDADSWADHCVRFCMARRLPYRVVSVAVANPGVLSGLELRAREARYQAFSQVLSQVDSGLLLLAHHAHDQWETILMRLVQGTGLAGLLGMRETTAHGGVVVARPMLGLPRQDCEAYLQILGLSAIADDSNENEVFTRGFIRQHVTPVVSSRWPQVARTVSKQSRIWAQDFAAMDVCVQQILVQVTMHYFGLPYVCVKMLDHYPLAVRVVLLKSWLRAEGYRVPDHNKLITFITQAHRSRGERCPYLIQGDSMLTVDRGRVFLLPASARNHSGSEQTVVSRAGRTVLLSNLAFVWAVNAPDNASEDYCDIWHGFSLANVTDVWLRSAKSKKKLLQSLRVPWFLRGFYPALLLEKTAVGVAGKIWSQHARPFAAVLTIGLKVRKDCTAGVAAILQHSVP